MAINTVKSVQNSTQNFTSDFQNSSLVMRIVQVIKNKPRMYSRDFEQV